MTETKPTNKTVLIVGIAAGIVCAALVAVIIVLLTQNKQKDEDIAAMEEMMTFEKEQLENEYADLAIQYDGYQVNISNDSLVELLAQEKQRVQDLLEELRTTKATDGRRIAELKKELATVRAVMKEYVAQIDSLDRTNKQLVKENQQVKQQYEAVTAQNETLTQEKTKLTEVVSRAAMMEVGNFHCITLNKRDRQTDSFSKIAKLQFNFSVMKNITAAPGNKMLYAQLRQPDGELMLLSEAHTFTYENARIPYSLKKDFEFTGEAIDLTLYWSAEDGSLVKGTYTIDFFIDGNMCGSFPFTLK